MLEDKNLELEQKIDIVQVNKEWSSGFTMALKGVIDAAVNGGVDIYKKAFFTEEYEKNNPTHSTHIVHLKALLEQQIQILEKGLLLHKQVHPATLNGLHTQLESKYLINPFHNLIVFLEIFEKMKHDSISSKEVATYIAEEDKWKKLIIKEEEEQMRKIREPAAVIIQKVFRGYRARKQYRILTLSKTLFFDRRLSRSHSFSSYFSHAKPKFLEKFKTI